jgi:hypothetical protein
MQQAAAARLVNEAYNRQSMDNLAVVVIDLQGSAAATARAQGAATGLQSSSSSSFAVCGDMGEDAVGESGELRFRPAAAGQSVGGDGGGGVGGTRGCLNPNGAAGLNMDGEGEEEVFDYERGAHGMRNSFGVPLFTLESLDEEVLQTNCGLFELGADEFGLEGVKGGSMPKAKGAFDGGSASEFNIESCDFGDEGVKDSAGAAAGSDDSSQVVAADDGKSSSCPADLTEAGGGGAEAAGHQHLSLDQQACRAASGDPAPASDGGSGRGAGRGSVPHAGLILWCKELQHHYQISSYVSEAPAMTEHVHLHVTGTGDASLQR